MYYISSQQFQICTCVWRRICQCWYRQGCRLRLSRTTRPGSPTSTHSIHHLFIHYSLIYRTIQSFVNSFIPSFRNYFIHVTLFTFQPYPFIFSYAQILHPADSGLYIYFCKLSGLVELRLNEICSVCIGLRVTFYLLCIIHKARAWRQNYKER